MHKGKEKNNTQASLLVRRYKTYSCQLIAAEARLAQLLGGMDKTPEGERAEFVQVLKHEVTEMAKRE